MWYIETDNVIRIKNLQNVETEEYVNDATVTGILYRLPEFNPDIAGVAVDKSPGVGVGIPVAAHGVDVLGSVRLENFINYNGDFIVQTGSSANEIVIDDTYVAETFTGEELIYEAVVGTVLAPITFTYVSNSNGDYVGKVPKTAPLIQGTRYMMCIWEVTGTEQVLAKIIEEAGFQGL
jgi:hypothetical protein